MQGFAVEPQHCIAAEAPMALTTTNMAMMIKERIFLSFCNRRIIIKCQTGLIFYVISKSVIFFLPRRCARKTSNEEGKEEWRRMNLTFSVKIQKIGWMPDHLKKRVKRGRETRKKSVIARSECNDSKSLPVGNTVKSHSKELKGTSKIFCCRVFFLANM